MFGIPFSFRLICVQWSLCLLARCSKYHPRHFELQALSALCVRSPSGVQFSLSSAMISSAFLQLKAVTQLAISIKFCSISLLQLATTWLSVFLNADDDVTYAASSVCVYNLPGRESEALPEGKHFRETVAHVKSQGSNVSHGRKTGVEIASTWRSRGAFLPETNTVPMTMSRVCFLISSDNTNNIASVILGIFSNDCASFHRFIYFSTS